MTGRRLKGESAQIHTRNIMRNRQLHISRVGIVLVIE